MAGKKKKAFKKSYAAIAAAAIILAIAAVVLLDLRITIEPPNPPGPGPANGSSALSFAEVAREDLMCSNDTCLIEYIIVSDGTVMSVVRRGDDTEHVEIRQVDRGKAAEAITAIRALQEGGVLFNKANSLYHIYTYSGSPKQAFFGISDAAGKSAQRICEGLYAESRASDIWFLQFVFWRNGGLIQDYHIFSTGAVVRISFTQDTEAKSSQAFGISGSILKTAINMSQSLADSRANSCGRDGFSYGYVLTSKGGSTRMAYTCGAGSSPADSLFNYLLENVAE